MKRFKFVAIIMIMSICFAFPVFASGWEQNSTTGIWKYQCSDGTYATSCWKWIDSKCYCFDSNGNMFANTITPDGYCVDASGAWIQEWQNTRVDRVLYEDREVTITGISFGPEKPYYWSDSILVLRLNIRNKTNHNVCVQIRDESVNDMACDAIFSCDIPAGKSTNDTIDWYSYSLSNQGLTPETVTKVEFKFTVFSWENLWGDNEYSDIIVVTR